MSLLSRLISKIAGSWLAKSDKLLHMSVGIMSSQILFILLSLFLNKWISIVVAFAVATEIMHAKEWLWDGILEKGCKDYKDFFAGLIGIVYGTLVCVII